MSVIDWESKPEPWRSIGLEWIDILSGQPPKPLPWRAAVRRPDLMSGRTAGRTPGERLRNLRLARGWTQEMLAARAGCGEMSIHYIENDKQSGRRYRHTMASALGVEIHDIWYEGD